MTSFVQGATIINTGQNLSISSPVYARSLNIPAARNNTYSTLMFPSDLVDSVASRTAYINIGFSKYQRPSIFNPPKFQAIDNIILPMPSNMVDKQGVTYSEIGSSNPIIGAGLETLAGNGKEGDYAKALQGTALGIGGNLLSSAIASATRGISNQLSLNNFNNGLSLAGLTVNPFLNVLFTAPQFKTHVFNWRFTPSNEQESKNLANIINKIRAHQLPTKVSGLTGSILLGYPDVAIINFNPDQYLYKFKPCVMEDMVVNYTPSGFTSWKAIDGDQLAPSEIHVTIAFKEIEYWLAEDYNLEITTKKYNEILAEVTPGNNSEPVFNNDLGSATP